MPTFKLTIVSPRGKVLDQEVESLVAPGLEGDFGVLANHTSMIAALRHGVAKVSSPAGTQFFAVGEGILEVYRNEVNVLVDVAEPAKSIDEAKTLVAQFEEQIESRTAIK